MTAPRAITPGRTYLITRRCTQRQLLLRPSDSSCQAFVYCLAQAATKAGVQVVEFCALSNHYHAVVQDPHAQLPAFLEQFHKMLAKVMNCRLGRWENFWASESTSMVECVTAEDVLRASTYTVTNPVRHHLVERVYDWPGANSLGARLRGKTIRVKRPSWYFDPHGVMPEWVELELACPRGFAEAQAWRERLQHEVTKVEASAAVKRRERGIRVVGRKAVLRQSPFATPTTSEPRRNRHPLVACRDPQKRAEALRRIRQFRDHYRRAVEKLRAGIRDVLFPAGTYLYRIRNLVDCEPFPAPP